MSQKQFEQEKESLYKEYGLSKDIFFDALKFCPLSEGFDFLATDEALEKIDPKYDSGKCTWQDEGFDYRVSTQKYIQMKYGHARLIIFNMLLNF